MGISLDRRSLLMTGAGITAAGALAACGNDSNKGNEGSNPTEGQKGDNKGAAVDWDKKGPISYAQGKDTSGYVAPALERWNAEHPDEKITLIELSDKADEQRQKFIDNANTDGSAGYDVISMDIVWTAEFAGNQWILEMPKDQFPTDGMLESSVDGFTYFDKLYAMPANSDGCLLYYRKDLLDAVGAKAPTTWDEMFDAGRKVMESNPNISIFGGQFQKYEGLTCNFAEWVNSAGANFLDDQGKPTVNTDEAIKGVQYLADRLAAGDIPKAASTWKEEESRVAFQEGQVIFHRNWPYIYSLANKTDGSSKIPGKFDICPFPGMAGPGVSTLGGHAMAITKTCKNPGTARDFIKWYTSQEEQKKNLMASSQAPTIEALYTDAELVKQFPYLPVLLESIKGAKARPKAVKYGDVTLAIQDAAYSIVQDPKTDVKAVLDKLQEQLTQLTV